MCLTVHPSPIRGSRHFTLARQAYDELLRSWPWELPLRVVWERDVDQGLVSIRVDPQAEGGRKVTATGKGTLPAEIEWVFDGGNRQSYDLQPENGRFLLRRRGS